jgi:hypothetical protein
MPISTQVMLCQGDMPCRSPTNALTAEQAKQWLEGTDMNHFEFTDTTDRMMRTELDEVDVYLQSHLSGRIRDLTLFLHEGGVILRGFTRTYYAKQLAQAAVMRLTELPILANEIEVS